MHLLGHELPVIGLPLCLPRDSNAAQVPSGGGGDGAGLQEGTFEAAADGRVDANLATWLEASAPDFQKLVRLLRSRHKERLRFLEGAAEAATESIWWPFTQHANVQVREKTRASAESQTWLLYRDFDSIV